MYFITALVATIISGVLWFLYRDRKALHLEVLAIAYGSATLMWLIDVILAAADGENPFGFTATDGWISLLTIVGGILIWLTLGFIFNNSKKTN